MSFTINISLLSNTNPVIVTGSTHREQTKDDTITVLDSTNIDLKYPIKLIDIWLLVTRFMDYIIRHLICNMTYSHTV